MDVVGYIVTLNI